jgi:hypothetical protein
VLSLITHVFSRLAVLLKPYADSQHPRAVLCSLVGVQELPNLRPECLRVLEVSTNFLQRCAAAGLSLADIGALASRPLDALDGDDSNPSELEKACVAARQVCLFVCAQRARQAR